MHGNDFPVFSTRKRLIVVAVSACFAAAPAWGNPTAPQVINGSASFNQAGKLLTVNNSNGAIINWNSFSIGANETTRFNQASASSSVLNRVIANDPSVLLGTLSSNGRVWLVNPAGIMVGQGAKIDVAGFIASTLNVRSEDFLAGRLNFGAAPNAGSIHNYGQITTPSGGSVLLVAPNIENHGIINAPNGEVILAAGQTAQLIDTGTPGVKVDIAGAEGKVTNLGEIVAEAGRIGMAGVLVKNSGTLNASSLVKEGGRIFLRANKETSLESASLITASGARGGDISVASEAGIALLAGSVEARGDGTLPGGDGGQVNIQADALINIGSIDASGAAGGTIAIDANRYSGSATLRASGAVGDGGSVSVAARQYSIQTSRESMIADGGSAGSGGSISVQAAQRVFSSANISAQARGAGQRGGDVKLLADEVMLFGANVNASGAGGGGSVRLGGDYQGKNPTVPNASTTLVNFGTSLRADATQSGDGGKVIVWSDRDTRFAGRISARGGPQAGDGGFIEVSGKEKLGFSGTADAGATNGAAGSLLLDPKNIIIDAATGSVSSFALMNPNPDAGNGFPTAVAVLDNDNVVATDWRNDFGGADAGAAYLFNGATGALICNIYGAAGDQVGSQGIATLKDNNNFVVLTQYWGSGTYKGAATWGDGSTGFIGGGGLLSSANSLVGSNSSDSLGSGGVTALTNGNYVVSSPFWNAERGAATWVNGSTGKVADYVANGSANLVTSANSVLGTTVNDEVGNNGIKALANGNYVVISPDWNSSRGAVTWVNGSNGQVSDYVANSNANVLSSANSVIGSTPMDRVGNGGVTELANGSFVVASWSWNQGATTYAGAATWVDGTNGRVSDYALNGNTNVVSTANSLYGSTASDFVGSDGVTALANGNYVVNSQGWDNGAATNVGAVTWVDGTNGRAFGEPSAGAAVSASNSLVGSATDGNVGYGGVTALANGNFVVASPFWINGGTVSAGAVTWIDGSNGQASDSSIVVSAANSLVGSNTNDRVGYGGVFELSNGNYVVVSDNWNAAASQVGAVSFVNPAVTTPGAVGNKVGVVSTSNSLVGSTLNDRVGNGGIAALSNGNYVVKSPDWDSGGVANVGAVTWGNGSSGIVGTVGAGNSLVGSNANDRVGYPGGEGDALDGVVALPNGNYVVASAQWNASRGAVTWGNGSTGIAGTVTAGNSLVGSQSFDRVGSNGLTVLSNGNYVVISPYWNGTSDELGAVTFGSGTAGVSGVVSGANSLVGTYSYDGDGDNVGSGGVVALAGGDYLVLSPNWKNDFSATSRLGAATFGSGTTGVTGEVTTANSFIGTADNDRIGSGGAWALSDGKAVVSSPDAYDAGSGGLAGAGLAHVLAFLPASPSDPATGQTFAANPSADATITPAAITAITNTGTAVVLQANNDITLAASSDITTSAGGAGGAITLQAGRSILLGSSITTDNGDFTAIAGDPGANPDYRNSGARTLVLDSGADLNTGTGAATLSAIGGYIRIDGSISAAGAGSEITTSGTLTVNGTVNAGAIAVSAGRFSQGSGTWNQISATLPGFDVDDFEISGGTFIRALGGDGSSGAPYQLADIYGVQGVGSAGMLGNSYVLANNIDAAVTVNWNPEEGGGEGFVPVGTSGAGFTGSFDGQGRSISNLTINRQGSYYVGLFGENSGTIDGLNLVNASVSGYYQVGTLAGINSGTVSNSSATGVVDGGEGHSGGLIGENSGSVTDSYAMVAVSNSYAGYGYATGGLVGYNTGSISNAYATGSVSSCYDGSCGSYVGGLVGYNYYGTISNSHATGNVSGGDYVGGLVGYNEHDDGITITDAYASGSVMGNSYLGGLVGYNYYGQIERSYAGGDVTGAGTNVGGLIGYNNYDLTDVYATGSVSASGYGDNFGGLVGYNDGSIVNAYATGGVNSCYDGSCGNYAGGLVGYNSYSSISNTYATGNVYGGSSVGGLVGKNDGGIIGSSYVSGVTVTSALSSGNANAGGLVGLNASNGSISDSYVVGGSVNGAQYNVGGLVGYNYLGSITNSYASTSVVSGVIPQVGALVGNNEENDTVSNSFWNSDLYSTGVGWGESGGHTGLTTGEMKQLASFSSWNDATPNTIVATGGSTAVWRIYEGSTTPLLRSFLKPLTVTANADSRTFDGSAYSGGNGVSYSIASPVLSVGLLPYSGTSQGAVNAGSYSIVPDGYYSTQQQGYDITHVGGSLTINPATLTLASISAALTGTASKTYDGTTTATLAPGNFLLSGFANSDSASVTKTSATYASKNVGSNILVSTSLDSGDFSPAGSTNLANYTLPTSASGSIGVITPASLTVSGMTAQNKVYDATPVATITGTATFSGVLGADLVTLGGSVSGSFADKNAGLAKPVTVTGLTLSGADAGNYTLSGASAGLSADITPASLTLSGLTAQNKVYDATTVATLGGTAVFSGVLGSDLVTLGGSAKASFADKNVGVAKPVTVTGLSLAGADAGNYTLAKAGVSTNADITPASVTLTGLIAKNKVYDATTVATLGETPAFSGVLGADVVTLGADAKASFADKNVGIAKPVTVTGLSLAGADAGNYKLASTTAAATADINVRPLSTWIGGASGNWSLAANWDALPDLANVQAVSVPAGASVTYDAAAGSTSLNSLSASALVIAGGDLNIASSLTVSSSFSQSGGSLAFGAGASASITQASGNLDLPGVTLANLQLNAPSGAISQSGAIVATTLNTQSQSGTTLTDGGNRIANFSAVNTGSGKVTLTNTGALTIAGIANDGGIAIDNAGAVATTGAIRAPAGTVSILAHSPLSIGAGGVSAAGDIALSAGQAAGSGDTLLLAGPVSSSGAGSITLSAGDDLVQNANVTTNGGAASAVSQTGNISMAPGSSTSSGGGGIGYAAGSGNIVLASLNAGAGDISLGAGGSIQPAAGASGANLIGGKAVIVAGGSIKLSTAVRLLDVTAEGAFSISDTLTGTVISELSAAVDSSKSTAPAVDQVLSTVTNTTQQEPTQTTTRTTTDVPPPPGSGGTGAQLLASTTQTIGGTADTFGGGSFADSLPATSAGSAAVGSSGTPASGQSDKPTADKPAAAKPADDKLASAKKDDTKAEDKKDEKKKDEQTTAKKEDRPAAKKLATCGR